MSYRELLVGAGHARDKRVLAPGTGSEWQGLVTLDCDSSGNPDHLVDLNRPWVNVVRGLETSSFDEVHAYEVLEHLGHQGDYRAFFQQFYDLWSVLKPEGFLCGTVPSRYSAWLWGDPGHTRAILPETLAFLAQPFYEQCDGPRPTAASDYRSVWRGDFALIRSDDDHTYHRFVLQAVKPPRIGKPKAKKYYGTER